MSMSARQPSSSPQWFVTTHWSVILAATSDLTPSTAVREAWEQLARSYWYPLYAYARRSGQSHEDAEDLIQGFFLACLQKDYLDRVDRSKGRFRSFLLIALKAYMANDWVRKKAQKRGGDAKWVELDSLDTAERYALEPADRHSADKLYERRWALTLLERVLSRLKEEQCTLGRGKLFDRLSEFLVTTARGTPYARLAEELKLSESAIKVAVHRLRHRYREMLLEEIAQTVSDPGEIEAERRYLLSVLAQGDGTT